MMGSYINFTKSRGPGRFFIPKYCLALHLRCPFLSPLPSHLPCHIMGASLAAHICCVVMGHPCLHECWSPRAVHHPLGAASSGHRLAGAPRLVWACTGDHHRCWLHSAGPPVVHGRISYGDRKELAPGPRGVTLLGGALGGHLGMARPLTAT